MMPALPTATTASPPRRGFETVRAAVMAAIEQYGAGAPKPVFEFGEMYLDLLEEHIGQNQTKPSIVWVPIGGPVTLDGALRSPTSVRDPAGVKGPRKLGTFHQRTDVYFWTESLDHTWWLFQHFCAAARVALTAHGFSEPMSVRWSAPERLTVERGVLLILSFDETLAVTFEPQPYAPAPHTPNVTGAFVAPDQITTPQGEELPS